jgi:hypothetical protein
MFLQHYHCLKRLGQGRHDDIVKMVTVAARPQRMAGRDKDLDFSEATANERQNVRPAK